MSHKEAGKIQSITMSEGKGRGGGRKGNRNDPDEQIKNHKLQVLKTYLHGKYTGWITSELAEERATDAKTPRKTLWKQSPLRRH